MEKLFNSSEELADILIHSAEQKVKQSFLRVLILGIMAGAFIAFGAEASSAASYSIPSTGLAKTLAGIIFPTGLMMIVIAGGQLFTGSCLNLTARFDKKLSVIPVLSNITLVYFSNFIGAMLIAYAISACGELTYSNGELGAYTIKIAAGKVSLSYSAAIVSGILCNILVCLGIVMAAAAKDITGKVLAIFFPIFLFIISGFEHCVANMYYIPAGILAKSNPEYIQKAIDLYHINLNQLELISYTSMIVDNLIPVTIGNTIGGVIVGGCMYLIRKK